MRLFVFLLLTVFMWCVAVPVHPAEVDLVKLKKQEEERKKNAKKAKYTLTNENLETIKVPQKGYGFSATNNTKQTRSNGQADGQAQAGPQEQFSEDKGEGREAPDSLESKQYWQEQLKNLLTSIENIKNTIKQQKELVSGMLSTYLGDISAIEKNKIKLDMDQMHEKIAKNEAQLAELEQKLEDLHERARKAGVPPGWLRL